MFTNALRASSCAVALAVLAGCSSATAEDPVAPPAASTRTVTDATGEVEVPVDPQKVVAIDEYAAMAMLSAGVEPDLVYLTFASAVSAPVFEHLGIETREEPTFLSEPDFEQVTLDAPDLVVMSAAGPLLPSLEQFEQIAPTVALTFDAGWTQVLEETGDVFDVDVSAVEAAVSARVEEVAAVAEGRSLSVLLDYEGVYYPTPDAPVSRLIADAGLTRPEAQLSTEGEIPGEYIAPVSDEALPAHDADLVALLDAGYYEADLIRARPTAGFTADGTDVDGETWFGSAAFTMWWVLDDLESMAQGGPAATAADAVARWDEYSAAAGLGG